MTSEKFSEVPLVKCQIRSIDKKYAVPCGGGNRRRWDTTGWSPAGAPRRPHIPPRPRRNSKASARPRPAISRPSRCPAPQKRPRCDEPSFSPARRQMQPSLRFASPRRSRRPRRPHGRSPQSLTAAARVPRPAAARVPPSLLRANERRCRRKQSGSSSHVGQGQAPRSPQKNSRHLGQQCSDVRAQGDPSGAMFSAGAAPPGGGTGRLAGRAGVWPSLRGLSAGGGGEPAASVISPPALRRERSVAAPGVPHRREVSPGGIAFPWARRFRLLQS
ncbi:PREDICTED: translation initiation factor IF-2-like [Lepidothrix coronata]|uniref:Translation initiation factor IF-2-like n=1 Tax=Lepidothrix coronata TaxID=321398 RepID=A0A6J0HMB9_9PASS|nr:PREDICTED: translation initiation factor IF-2-like [Lepidothrix coronata]